MKIHKQTYTENDSFLSPIKADIQRIIIFLIVAGFWLTFVFIGFLSLKSFKFETPFDQNLSHLLAVAIFGGLVGFLSMDKFELRTFCVMNKNDPLCFRVIKIAYSV